MQVFLTGLIM